MNKADYYST